jgi:hypothetical protein
VEELLLLLLTVPISWPQVVGGWPCCRRWLAFPLHTAPLLVTQGGRGRDDLPTRTVGNPEPQPIARKVGRGLRKVGRGLKEGWQGTQEGWQGTEEGWQGTQLCSVIDTFFCLLFCSLILFKKHDIGPHFYYKKDILRPARHK